MRLMASVVGNGCVMVLVIGSGAGMGEPSRNLHNFFVKFLLKIE